MTTHEMAKQLMAMPDVPITVGGWPVHGMYRLVVKMEATGAVISYELNLPSYEQPPPHPLSQSPTKTSFYT